MVPGNGAPYVRLQRVQFLFYNNREILLRRKPKEKIGIKKTRLWREWPPQITPDVHINFITSFQLQASHYILLIMLFISRNDVSEPNPLHHLSNVDNSDFTKKLKMSVIWKIEEVILEIIPPNMSVEFKMTISLKSAFT